ncbi:hypothetical protein FDE94_09140 [Clostridium botulinum]|nr:hypothetical protein [Clostridium botulinum]NHI48031.1 hypothetical protein [Clostridium botulinum]
MFNFQMDNLLTLHNLIGESGNKGGITQAGRFSGKGTAYIDKAIVKSCLEKERDYIAIGSEGILFSSLIDNKVYFMDFNRTTSAVETDKIENSVGSTTIQLYPTADDGFIGIYKDTKTTNDTASFTVKKYNSRGIYVHSQNIYVDETQYSNSRIQKITQDPITKKYVFIFDVSFGSVPTYLVVLESNLNFVKKTFIEHKYSIDASPKSHMAYDGWLYGKSTTSYDKYCKFKYDTTDDISLSYSAFNCNNARAVVADPKTGLAYDISSGWMYTLSRMMNYSRVIPVYHHSSGDDVPVCINSSPVPENGFIICSKGWDFYEVNFRVPKTNLNEFAAAPEVRQINEVNANISWTYDKIFTSYDSKNMLRIGYEKNKDYNHNVYLYRR